MTAGDETGGRPSGLEALAAPTADIPLPGHKPAPRAAPVSSPALDRAVALHRAGKHDEALKAYDAILLETPGDPRIWVNQGVVLRALGRLDAAAACYRRAIALDPGNAGIHSNLGNVLRLAGHLDEALDCQQRALRLDPANHAAEYNTALILRDVGKTGEALTYFDRAIAGGHARPEVMVEHAMTLLAAGDYARGFQAYEARLSLPNAAPAGSDAPPWDGGPLEGKSILVQGESGTRDTITFLRYLPALAARGAKVMVSATAALAGLAAALPGVALVVPAGRRAPASDWRIALNSLPLLFGTQPDTVPQEVPYLAVPPGRRPRQWVAPAASGERKVGLVWSDQGRDRAGRVPPFALFLRLAGLKGIALYRLQTGAAAAQRDEHASAALVRDLAGDFTDLTDAAEAIGQLDLVLGVDSAALLLAGALGRPGMVVLPTGADWRWGAAGDRSPWFPSLRVFRQDEPGAWDALFARLAEALGGTDAAAAAPPPEAKSVARRAAPPAPPVQPPPARSPPQPPLAQPLPVRAAPPLKPSPAAPELAASIGPRHAVRRFLEEHVAPVDVLVEAGAGREGYALGVARRHAGQLRAILVETQADMLEALRKEAEGAGLVGAVETLRAGLGAKASPPRAAIAPRTTVDALLRDRPDRAGRVFLCLGTGERVGEIVAGAMDLLAQRRIAAILWRAEAEDGAAGARVDALLDDLAAVGFGHFRLPDDDLGGRLMPYVRLAEPATVFSLAPGIERRSGYVGAPRGGQPLLDGPRYASLDTAQRRARTAALAARRSTDAARWADPANLEDGAEERALLAAPHLLRAGAHEAVVLDLGCGLQRLAHHLPRGTRYVPADLALRGADTVLIDLNQGEFPPGAFDSVAMLDVLEFVHDAAGLLQRARAASGRLVLTYRLSDGYDHDQRAEAGWFNAFSRSVLESHLAIAGWLVGAHHRAGPYDLFVCNAADTGV